LSLRSNIQNIPVEPGIILVNLIRDIVFPMDSGVASHDIQLPIENHHTKLYFSQSRHRRNCPVLVLPQDLPTRAICPRFTSKNINQLFNLSNLLPDSAELSAADERSPPPGHSTHGREVSLRDERDAYLYYIFW
jgi:hypothetical protein